MAEPDAKQRGYRLAFWVWAILSIMAAADHDLILWGISMAFAAYDGRKGYA